MYRVSGKPIELNILTPTPQHPMGWQQALEFCRDCFRQGVRMHPQFTTNRLELHLKLADTFVFDEMPAWRDVLTTPEPERARRLADPAWRAKLQHEWDDDEVRAVAFDLGDLEVEAVRDREHAGWVGRTIVELCAERGTGKRTPSSTCPSQRTSRRASARARAMSRSSSSATSSRRASPTRS
jgi:hypothetical protein